MYIFGFIKSFFRLQNFFTTLYFILNNVIIYFVFKFFNLFPVEPFYNGLIGVGINVLLALFTLSPVGEWILRILLGAKKIPNENVELKRVERIFEVVYKRALNESPKIGNKVKIYYQNSDEVNACALGRRTIAVTTGLLSLADDQIAGILAHEFGHIANRDGDMQIAVCVSNFLLTVVIWVVRALAWIAVIFLSLSDKLNFLGVIISFIFDRVLMFILGLWLGFGMLLVNISSRKHEYAADAYACKIGFKQNLYNALKSIDPSGVKVSMLALISRTHPATVDRLAAIKNNV